MADSIRVLYVEDEPDIREIAGLALEDEGFELVSCRSGREALERAPGLRPDLILVDVMMPGMDGPTTVARLRELTHLAATPVVFMTAKVQPSELAHYETLGAVGVIPKPFDATTLASQLRAMLGTVGGEARDPGGAPRLETLDQAFEASLPERLASLREAVAAAEAARSGALPFDAPLRRLAHSLAGAAGTFGFRRLGDEARALELRLLAPDVELPLSGAALAAATLHLAELARLAARGPDGRRASRPAAPGAPRPESGVVHVLEDDPQVGAEIGRQLHHFGYATELFASSRELARAWAVRPPAALVADVVLPEGDLEGPRVAAELQAGAGRAVPVVYVSVRTDWNAHLAAIRAGGRAYLPKPLDFGALAEQLDRLTGRAPEPPLRVVVVDDDALLAEHYARVLRQAGMEVDVVTDPATLLGRLSAHAPDLVLLDVYLPGCTGVEVVQMVRQDPAFTLVPIVFLSTERSLDAQLLALAAGGDDFLEKPIGDAHLSEAVRIRARRFRELSSLATRDGLTGLLNHISILQALDREVSRARRSGGESSLALVDLDGFKSVNDERGHPAGDRVLRSLARLFAHRLRKADLAGRYGGEEFALVLPDTDRAAARALLDELRESFSAIQFVEGSEPFRVTFSAGIASVPPHGTVDDLVRAADRALYAAKRAGRDRVVVEEPEAPTAAVR